MELFSRFGYDGVGISEICARVGITPTSLYAAYSSKFNLFKLAIDLYAAGPGRFVAEELAKSESPQTVWFGILRAAATQYSTGEEKGCPVLDGLLGSRDPYILQFTVSQANATQAIIQGRLEELGDADAKANAQAILVIMRGLSTAARAGAAEADLLSVVETLLNQRMIELDHGQISASGSP